MSIRKWTEAEIAKVREMTAQGISARMIGLEIGRSEDAVYGLKKKIDGLSFCAISQARRDQVPADFAEHAYEPLNVLKPRYQVGHAVITRWRRSLGITQAMLLAHAAKMRASSEPTRKKAPEGFFEYQQGRPLKAVATDYGVSEHTVRRWLSELGINRQQQYNEARAAQKAIKKPAVKAVPDRKPWKSTFVQTAAPDRPYVDPSPAGQAAEFLRRFGPVVRCNEQGRYDPAGDRWRRGSSLLTADEIIERAVRNGWQSGRMAA